MFQKSSFEESCRAQNKHEVFIKTKPEPYQKKKK